MSVDRLRFSDLNPRGMTRAEERDLTEGLQKFTLLEGLIVNRRGERAGTVIGGNQRLLIARKLGWSTVPVVWVDLDLEDERELNLRLNRNHGHWDLELLAMFDRGLLERVGFTQAELSSLLEIKENEEVDLALPEVAETEPGDLLFLGDHLLLCGDATLRASYVTLLGTFGRGLPMMVFTDPPYGISYVGGTGLTIKGDADLGAYERSIGFWPVRQGGAVYVCCPSTHSHLFVEIFRRRFYFSQKLIWVKDSATLGRQDYQWRHEEILFGRAREVESEPGESYPEAHEEIVYGWEKGRHLFHANRKQTTVWEFPKPKRSSQHPTMKPVALVGRAIYNSSRSGELVIDPFSGSGSTLEACEHLGRRFVGLEVDPKYCDVIVRRWEALTGGSAKRERPGKSATLSKAG